MENLDIYEEINVLKHISPFLNYNYNSAKILSEQSKLSTKELICAYFRTQPKKYVDELNNFYQLNKVGKKKIMVFIPTYNEESNVENIIKMYAKQKFSSSGNESSLSMEDVAVNFIVNYPFDNNKEKYSRDVEIFNRTLKKLIQLKEKHSFVNIIGKEFTRNTYGLARARKYGLDFSLLCSLYSSDPDKSFIISNEGDTLSINDDYLEKFYNEYRNCEVNFVQGEIKYPEFVNLNEATALFTQTREYVHLGQGLDEATFKHFQGILPIGRNMAVHPKLAAMVGSIDATFKKGTDDDMTFGADIFNLFGAQFKKYSPIPLITNPRREIFIVKSILNGDDLDAKKMYEDFNNTLFLYDKGTEYYAQLVKSLRKNLTHSDKVSLVNQYYQWVWRTIAKNYFSELPLFKIIQNNCNNHNIGYWERENEFVKLYHTLNNNKHKKLFARISEEALFEFNKLISPLNVQFSKVTIDVDSKLI